MSVYHVLKDGSTVEDITGRIVSVKDAKAVYNLISEIQRGSSGGNKRKARNEKVNM